MINKDKEINKLKEILKEILNDLTDKKDIQSINFAINLPEDIGTLLLKNHEDMHDYYYLCTKSQESENEDADSN